MGLFSFLNKNKQEATAEDSGYYSRPEDDSLAAARARSKRASSAGEPAERRGNESKAADPVLPEKKRARRRLVGAVALALAVAVGLPMLLDAEPKPLASDIAIRIPAREKVAPLPMPALVPAADTLDQREEIVDPAKAAPPSSAAPVADVKAAAVKPDSRSEPKPEPARVVPARPAPEHKSARAEPVPPAPRPADKPADKASDKAAGKPSQDAGRALAILEGKAPGKPGADDPAPQKYVLQVAALLTQDKVNQLQGKLREAGISSFTQSTKNAAGEHVIRVRVGPLSKDDADKMRARLGKLGLAGSMIPS